MRKVVFGDTSAIVAKLVDSERYHKETNQALRDLLREGGRILTTDYIFDEVVTRVRSVADHAASVKAGEYILESSVVEFLEIDEAVREAAWLKYKKYKDQVFSFTDCTSFAVMEKYKVKVAFTLDGDFAKVGFQTIPPREKS